MNTINKIPRWFSKQSRLGKILIGVTGLLFVLFIYILFAYISLSAKQQASFIPSITATSAAGESIIVTTWTPTSTDIPQFTNTPNPTRTSFPTGLPTQSLDTATPVIIIPPTLIPSSRGSLVVITNVDKQLEFVDIQNVSYSIVKLAGWELVSEVGNQVCLLKGSLKSKEVLRIFAGMAGPGQVGISCGFHNPIWLDQEPDPAVLYNPRGEEVSRYPAK